MATTKKDTLLAWLKDAHAMENAAVSMLEEQDQHTQDHSQVKQKMKEHLEISRQHKNRIGECIKQLGGDVSATKESTGTIIGNMQAMMSAAAGDQVVKNGIANYAFENFEIASYKSLIAACKELGEQQIQKVCEENLRQDQEMAQWLDQHLPEVTKMYLQKEAVPQG